MITLEGKYCKDCIIYNDEVENEALALIHNILNTKEFKNTKVRIMPDVHSGKGIVIGFTSTIQNAICPSHIGVDIGCCIDTYITDMPINSNDFAKIDSLIKERIPFGKTIQKETIYDKGYLYAYLQKYYDNAMHHWQEMILPIIINENYISDMLKRLNMDEAYFYNSLGSVGGGNHFIELGNYHGNYAYTIHCGSRNFGVKVCDYWTKIANTNNGNKKKEYIKNKIKELVNTIQDKTLIPDKIIEIKNEADEKFVTNDYLTNEDLKSYLSDMVIATAYSQFNHIIIAHEIKNILEHINKSKINLIDYICSMHNYIDFKDHIIRKGAIRAYQNEKMVVPFNMRDGIAICEGKSNSNWNYSCAHGSGRKLSRSKAKEILSLSEFQTTMKDVFSSSVCNFTLDEAPMAYKDSEIIKQLISETCNILYIIRPIINIKSTID